VFPGGEEKAVVACARTAVTKYLGSRKHCYHDKAREERIGYGEMERCRLHGHVMRDAVCSEHPGSTGRRDDDGPTTMARFVLGVPRAALLA
jgi:hypothetical protein